MLTKCEIEHRIRQIVEKWMNTEDPKIANKLEKEYDRLTTILNNL